MSYGGAGSGGRYNSPFSGLGSSIYSHGSYGTSPSSSLHLPNSSPYRDAASPSRSHISTGSYPLSSSYSSAAIPSSSLYGSGLSSSLSPTSRTSSYSPSSLLDVPGIRSGSRSPRSPRSLSPSPGYSRFKPTGSTSLKTYTSPSSSLSPGSGYGLSSSRSASSLAPGSSSRRIPASGTPSSSDRYRSRYGSSGSLQDGKDAVPASRLSDRSGTGSQTSLNSSTSSLNEEGGERDYKKLYFEVKDENDRLKIKLKKSEEELDYVKRQLEKLMQNNKNSLSDVEKRERRAIERRLSEMEEESKEMERLLADNQRLRDENGALIRVISKLSK